MAKPSSSPRKSAGIPLSRFRSMDPMETISTSIKVDGKKVLISDGGHIYDTLSLDGTIKRLNSKIKKVADKMDIEFKDGTLSKVSTAEDFSDDMNRFIIAVSALGYGIGM